MKPRLHLLVIYLDRHKSMRKEKKKEEKKKKENKRIQDTRSIKKDVVQSLL